MTFLKLFDTLVEKTFDKGGGKEEVVNSVEKIRQEHTKEGEKTNIEGFSRELWRRIGWEYPEDTKEVLDAHTMSSYILSLYCFRIETR